jgi:hypothetical protein
MPIEIPPSLQAPFTSEPPEPRTRIQRVLKTLARIVDSEPAPPKTLRQKK